MLLISDGEFVKRAINNFNVYILLTSRKEVNVCNAGLG